MESHGRAEGAAAVEDIEVTEEGFLRVSSSSNPQSLASAISHGIYDGKKIVLRCIGAGAVNQGIKACAIARGYVAPRGVDLTVKPGFQNITGASGDKLSAVTLQVVVS